MSHLSGELVVQCSQLVIDTDAIERDAMEELREELGDLLLQVVFHARMAEERGLFAFEDVARVISDKMEARHPHIFGPQASDTGGTMDEIRWESLKAREREAKGQDARNLVRDLTTETVAGRLGTVREEISRGLAYLERQGALSVSPDLIEVVDLARLEQIAYGPKKGSSSS